MSLRLHNSLSDQKEDFVPLREGRVTLYVCGPTVYNDSHLGHAKTYVSFDVILRYLKYRGFSTFYVQNITDVGHLMGDADEGEDKMLKRARELELEPMAVAETYTTRHFQAMDRMGVIRPDICPRATGHIPEQLEAIEKMIEAGLAYEVNGSVYFDVSKDPEYGKLSNRSFEEMQEGARVEVRQEKRNPQDFALWKKAEAGHLMRWRDSYSGWGYPGWHTECAVMSTRYLGDSFDIHGGGMELKFPHHDCEISQARGLDKPFANYWMHNNMLTIDGQKMSKSYNNVIPLFAPEKQLRKAIMKIETDSKTVEEVKDPGSCNVFQLFQCFADQSAQQDLAEQYRAGGMGYGTAKQICFEAIRDELKDASEHYHQIRGDHAHLEGILEGGKDKARKVARDVVDRVRNKVGL